MLRALSYTYSILADEDADEHDFEEYMEEDEENTVSEDYSSRYAPLAEKVARDAIVADNSFASYILLADILFKQNSRLNEIKTLFEQIEAVASTSEEKASIEIGRARISRMENNPEEALVHFQKALDIDANFPGIWNSIGELQLSLEQPDAAEESFLKSIEVSPTVTGAYADLATLYIQQNNEEAALRVLEQGIDTNPHAADLNTALAMFYLTKDDLQKAEELIEEAEAVDPDMELVLAVRQIIELKKLQAQMSQLPTNLKQNKPKKRRW